MLSVHTLKPARGAKHSVRRLGRGSASGRGTTGGRGGKGQTARSGGSSGLKILGFRRLMQSTPKLRGFTTMREKASPVRIGKIELLFKSGETVNLETLKEKKLIPTAALVAKLVGGGDLTKQVSVEGVMASSSVKALVEKAGGTVK